jgi:hypothetical protein
MTHVYDQLVKGPNDFIGALAYSLYKQTKVEWIINLQAENGGLDPTVAECRMFHDRSELAAKRGIYGWLAEVGAALITNFLTIILVAVIAYGYGKLNAVNAGVDARVSQALPLAPQADQ